MKGRGLFMKSFAMQENTTALCWSFLQAQLNTKKQSGNILYFVPNYCQWETCSRSNMVLLNRETNIYIDFLNVDDAPRQLIRNKVQQSGLHILV